MRRGHRPRSGPQSTAPRSVATAAPRGKRRRPRMAQGRGSAPRRRERVDGVARERRISPRPSLVRFSAAEEERRRAPAEVRARALLAKAGLERLAVDFARGADRRDDAATSRGGGSCGVGLSRPADADPPRSSASAAAGAPARRTLGVGPRVLPDIDGADDATSEPPPRDGRLHDRASIEAGSRAEDDVADDGCAAGAHDADAEPPREEHDRGVPGV